MFVSFLCFKGDIGFHYYKTRHKEDYPIEEFKRLNSLHQIDALVRHIMEIEDVCNKYNGSSTYKVYGLSVAYTAKYADKNGNVVTRSASLPVSASVKNVKIAVPVYDQETKIIYIPEGEM